MRRRHNLAKLVFYFSLPIILVFLVLPRPAIPFYALLLAPIALAAMLHGYVWGTLVALAAMTGVGVLIARELDTSRPAMTL